MTHFRWPPGVKAYQVGGVVRDGLMGRAAQDIDHVVVGATAQDLLNAGFRQVGKDFPVFLHPVSHEEYALARTKRSNRQERGASIERMEDNPDVTLEEDLSRRDLTINAMAMDEHGGLIDPYGGARDIKLGVLRHVGSSFADDSLRILRVARFVARYGFDIAPETLTLMRTLHDQGASLTWPPERVWKETERALMEPHGSRYWGVLQRVGIGSKWFPGVLAWSGDRNQPWQREGRIDDEAMDRALLPRPLASRVARWSLPASPDQVGRNGDLASVWRRAGAPGEVVDRVKMTQTFWSVLGQASAEERSGPSAVWQRCLSSFDALRRPERWFAALDDVRTHAQDLGWGEWLPHDEALAEWGQALRIDASALAQSVPPQEMASHLASLRQAAWDKLAQHWAQPSERPVGQGFETEKTKRGPVIKPR